MYTFDDDQPEELLALMRDWEITTDRTGTTSASGRINDLRTLLRGEVLREFDELSQQGNTTNKLLKITPKGLLELFFPMNSLYKKKHTMRRAMRKPCDISFKRFEEQLTEINNFLPLFP